MFDLKKNQNTTLKKSTFGHFLEKGETVCAYNALKMITIYFDRKLYPLVLGTIDNSIGRALQSVPRDLHRSYLETIKRICEAHIFVPTVYNEIKYLEQIQKIVFTGPKTRVLVLHTTDRCNLRCRYCFIEGNIPVCYTRKDMNESVAKAAIDKFLNVIVNKEHPKNPSVVFYGGEPFLNWKVIDYSLRYLEEKQKTGIYPTIDKIVITNGTKLTPSIAGELKKHKVMVSVSIDGPQHVNDLNRVFRSGKGTFSTIMKGIKNLKLAGIKPTVSCVLSKESMPYLEETIRWLLSDLGVRALGFNHVSIVPNQSVYDPDYESQFGDSLIKAQEIIQAEYQDVYERRMNHKINNFLDRNILRADCTGCGEQMSVSPDGQIGICQGYMGSRKTFTHSVFDSEFNPAESPVFVEWSMRSPLSMSQCYDCVALATCGGGCPRNADFLSGSIWDKDLAFCHFAKKAQEWMIWKKLQSQGK